MNDCNICTCSSGTTYTTEKLEQYLTKTLRHRWSCNVTFKSFNGKIFKYRATETNTIEDALNNAIGEGEKYFYIINQIDQLKFIIIKNKNMTGPREIKDAREKPLREIVKGHEDDITIFYTLKSWRGG